MASNTKTLPENAIPEVASFLEAQTRIQRLKEAYPEIFEQLEQLKDDYNAKLEAADKAVRAKQVSCGPFQLSSVAVKYDANKLYEEVGRDRFLEIGGMMKTVQVYEVDRARLEANIASGTLSKQVVDEVRDISPRYKKPEKVSI